MTVRAGRLSCPLRIMQAPKRNGFTDTDARPEFVGTLFANPITKTGAERFVSPEYLATATMVFTARYDERVVRKPNRWLEYNGRQLNIEFAYDMEEPRKLDMVLGCTEVVK